jgi:hypothetical protein
MVLFNRYSAVQVEIMEGLSMWALCGMGYMMGQFFQLK